MAICDKWVALKIVQFFFCVACLVTRRVSQDDEARLALLLQKLSREWSLLTSVTWDSYGGAFADAVYGGYMIITFGLMLGRVFQEVPKGRRILEGFFLGFGMLFFLVLGGLELASLDSIPQSLVVNGAVLGSLSLCVVALFLIDLMGPRTYIVTSHSQTDAVPTPKVEKKVSIASPPTVNGYVPNGKHKDQVFSEKSKDLDLEKNKPEQMNKKEEPKLLEETKLNFIELDNIEKDVLEKSKFGSVRNVIESGNYVRLSDPLAEPDRLHYERELAKFNAKYFKEYLDSFASRLPVKEDYLPELQTPVFAKVKTGRFTSPFDDDPPSYDQKQRSKSPSKAKAVSVPTLQQLEDYLRSSTRSRRADTPAIFPMEPIQEKDGNDTEGRASGTPTDPGYVQYTANRWPGKRELQTPRHSPT